MADHEEQTYDDGRADNLKAMLRLLAQRIHELDANDQLLMQAGTLMQLIGDVRSELFHYEVRCTYDTPEIAEHRRLVDDAKQRDDESWTPTGWSPDDEESEW
ncbi:MAG: hypothetical protein KA154_06680 [Gemmatimonadaceae bacterium]|jgi:hypothetical protein|nr:hypothetical protein [Gemmatimonadaceae bacterium]MCC6432324.1 hypothetical protein [Gemmatimonadaceae bacterium]